MNFPSKLGNLQEPKNRDKTKVKKAERKRKGNKKPNRKRGQRQ
jgi:hypothetical protein